MLSRITPERSERGNEFLESNAKNLLYKLLQYSKL